MALNGGCNLQIYPPDATDFSRNGRFLNEPISCYITEELNGAYLLELEYPKDKTGKFLEIKDLAIIKTEGQLFRIPFIDYIQDSGTKVRATANHIFYDLANGFIESQTAQGKTCQEAMQIALQGINKFTLGACDVSGTNNVNFVSINPAKAVFEVLDTWGGELVRDNYYVAIKQNKGSDNGVLISYGKNLNGFSCKVDCSEIVTKIKPIGKNGITIESVNNGDKYLTSPIASNYPFHVTRELNLSDIGLADDLKAAAENRWGIIDVPSFNYTIDFIDLSSDPDYAAFKELLNLRVGDTVIVRHEPLGIDKKIKVIKTKFDVLSGKLVEIELGDKTKRIFDKITELDGRVVEVENTKAEISIMQDEIALKVDKDGVISSINVSPEAVTINASKVKIGGTANANGVLKILDASNSDIIVLDKDGVTVSQSAAPTKTTLNTNGIVVYDTNVAAGEDIKPVAVFSSDDTSIPNLKAGSIECPNVITNETRTMIYVNSSTGNDNNDGLTTGTALKTIQAAIDKLNKYLAKNVEINITGTFSENLEINGFIGSGTLTLKFTLNTTKLVGHISIQSCTSVAIKGTDTSNYGTIEATGANALITSKVSMLMIQYMNINANNKTTVGVGVYNGTFDIVYCTIANSTNYGLSCENARGYLANTKGTNTTAGVRLTRGSVIGVAGTVCTKDTTTWLSANSESNAYYGTVTPTTATISGGGTGTQTTATWAATSSGSYRDNYSSWRTDNNYVYQGKWDIYGPYTGAFWINNTDFRSVLSAKTIVSAKLFLSRRNSGGSSASQPIYVVGITNSSESGTPNRLKSYGQVGSYAWGESKWVTIPNAAITDLRAGTINALALYNGSSNYAIFEGADNSTLKPQIQVIYQ